MAEVADRPAPVRSSTLEDHRSTAPPLAAIKGQATAYAEKRGLISLDETAGAEITPIAEKIAA
ncbi:hypothetical protein SAMCCGM7_pB0131 (plasmid) [Sinorhizobium americanum CCGM7]|nr:hypothetical protein SAMCCGM7_pB0131 [Sinorhizobium americanum CCGM7]